jgi:hypothetical protein
MVSSFRKSTFYKVIIDRKSTFYKVIIDRKSTFSRVIIDRKSTFSRGKAKVQGLVVVLNDKNKLTNQANMINSYPNSNKGKKA